MTLRLPTRWRKPSQQGTRKTYNDASVTYGSATVTYGGRLVSATPVQDKTRTVWSRT